MEAVVFGVIACSPWDLAAFMRVHGILQMSDPVTGPINHSYGNTRTRKSSKIHPQTGSDI